MKMKLTAFLLALAVFFLPAAASADVVEGDTIVTLGENLTQQQKDQILQEMKAPKDATTITVSNAEEHKYLDQYVPKGQIGSKALSSSMITYTKKGSGLIVQTHNINWVTDAMYTNALITAGVKDANIYITAPFGVSGTAALTGLMKAYELSTNKPIDESVKQVANQEMVTTAKLGDQIGSDKAVQLVTRIKEELAKNPPKTTEDMRALIKRIAAELGIQLTDEQLNNLVTLFDKMKSLNIDWNQVGNQLNKAKEQVTAFLSSEEGQTLLDQLKGLFSSFIDFIKSLFK
ncbi:DUF1002 domain-containing protein [Ectobacillus ponti]|uniref:DUF1002 domain-containing protein n=1 Tax=Ectobacillus ponti TaxID=2961894 RepID=A0AA41X4B5_9BACI|nr:DUF1002 domain-containing protein [Ectobacillus ponti]MCP8966933.1 DUF1002 domain-containing protein [Ectobacillus ponti]